MDLSQLSDEDLKRLYNNDYSKLSTEAKDTLKSAPASTEQVQPQVQTQPAQQMPQQGPVSPGMLEQAGQAVMDYGVTPAVGALQTGYNIAKEHPIATGIAASYVPGVNKLPVIRDIAGTRQAAQNIVNRFAGAPSAATPTVGSANYPIGGQPMAPAPAQPTQPSVMQRGMDYANRMRQIAAQRVVGLGTSGAAVPGAVAAGGAAATGLAGGQMGAMTPEQRKQYYDSSMLGAMSGDAGLAAAIMNRGQ